MSEGGNGTGNGDTRSRPRGDGLVSPGVLDLDHVFDALASPRRRYICYTLLEDSEWSLIELSTKIAAWENGVAEDDVTFEDREQVYVSLYHAHVPKLVEDDVVEFDEPNGRITAGENARQVLVALEGVGASLDSGQERHARERDDCGET